MEAGGMTYAERILHCLDGHLNAAVALTLYGRAALALGFSETPEDYALSQDVDAVLWVGQAEALNESTNFWEAVDQTNADLAQDSLYVSHFFTEDQVVLLSDWREKRVRLPGAWKHLDLYRLGNLDLILSKLMRNDPIDRSDALFIVRKTGLSRAEVESAIRHARVPESDEIREQFAAASARLMLSF
jgi:hypothetical protein